jgi:mycothiol synthase
MRSIEILSPPTGPGRDDVIALLERVRDDRGFDPLSEQKAIGLERGRKSSTGYLLRDDGELRAYAHVEAEGATRSVEIVTSRAIDRAAREEMTAALLRRVIEEIGTSGGGSLALFMVDPDEEDVALVGREGLEVTRELLVLSRPSDPEDTAPPDGDSVRPFVVGVDEDAWLALNARAFAWHPEQGSWTRADLEAREAQPWFSAAGFLCAWIDDALAGSCWTKVHPGPDGVGEIYVMAVDSNFQGTGLGRRLLAHGLAHLTAQGVPSTILYVEADNTAALGLYRSVGFENLSRTVVASIAVP